MSRLEDPYRSDIYHELASIRANTQASVAFQAWQTGLLTDMNNSMSAVHDQMAAVRQQQKEALAIQQELLNREQLQSYLEEFIFQTEKLVIECSSTDTDIPASSRYFTLMSVLGKIKEDGINTSIIKGRDNKAAFENVVSETKALTQRLLEEPEVQEALEWAEAERLRKVAEQKRLKAERNQAEQERQQNIAKLERQVDALRMRLKTVPFVDQAKLEWNKVVVLVDRWCLSKYPSLKTPLIVLGVLVSPVFIGAFPIFLISCYVNANQRANELNKEVNNEIANINTQIADLKGSF